MSNLLEESIKRLKSTLCCPAAAHKPALFSGAPRGKPIMPRGNPTSSARLCRLQVGFRAFKRIKPILMLCSVISLFERLVCSIRRALTEEAYGCIAELSRASFPVHDHLENYYLHSFGRNVGPEFGRSKRSTSLIDLRQALSWR